jgi:hypothetical protein
MSSSMRNFVEAYAAVHNTEAKEELTSSRDCISEMNLSDLTDGDLDEIVEQVLEVMFSQGYSVDSAHLVFGEAFEESSIAGRQYKIERLCESLNRTFDVIDSKASTVALEEFAKYRNNKKLQESWSARFNQEKRIQRAHDRLVAAESLNVKTQLLKIVEKADSSYLETDMKKRKENNEKAVKDMKKMGTSMKNPAFEEVSQIRKGWGDAYRSIYEKKLDPVGQEDDDVNNDKKIDKTDKYLMNRRKAIGKAMGKDMKKEEVETIAERGPAVGGKRPPGRLAARRAQLDAMGVPRPGAEKQEVKKEEVESVDEALTGQRQMKARDLKGTPYMKGGGKRTSRDNKTLHNLATRNDGPGTPGFEKKSTGGKGARYAGYGDQGAGNKAARRSGNEPMRGNRDPRKMGESVQFSEAELKAFEEIVNSWED